MRALIVVALLGGTASAEVTATGAVRWAHRGGTSPAVAVAFDRPVGPVRPGLALEVAQLHRDASVDGVPFSLLVREVAFIGGVGVGRGPLFAQAGVRLALQLVRSSTAARSRHDVGLGVGGAVALGWRWPSGWQLAIEAVLDPVAGELTGDTIVFSVGPRVGYRFSGR